MASRTPNDHKPMSQGERLCWMAALILLLAIVAMHARANIGPPGECSLTAMAALKVAQMPSPRIKDQTDYLFVAFSRFIWSRARGDEAQFLKWYRLACVQHRVPRYYRVRNGEMVRGNGA